jgi:superoxide dismutase, Fe-Mn family
LLSFQVNVFRKANGLTTKRFRFHRQIAVISAETMTIHHTKHHNAYITNLNASLEKLDAGLSAGDITAIVVLQNAIKFNGGGHLNHTLFWENLTPEKNDPGAGALLDAAIRESFGDFLNMKEKLTAKAVAVQGSGWGWLAYDKVTGTSTILFYVLLHP